MFKRPTRQKTKLPNKKLTKPKLTEREMKRLPRKRLKESMKRKRTAKQHKQKQTDTGRPSYCKQNHHKNLSTALAAQGGKVKIKKKGQTPS